MKHENFINFMEKLEGNNPAITQQFIKTWRDGSILVGNQRMEVLEEIIVEAMGLDMESINFYHDRKLLDKAIQEFVDYVKECN